MISSLFRNLYRTLFTLHLQSLEKIKLLVILFIQELLWNFIQFVPSTSSPGGQEVIGAPIHPEWT